MILYIIDLIIIIRIKTIKNNIEEVIVIQMSLSIYISNYKL